MKKILLLILLAAVMDCVNSQTTHVVEEDGLTYSPATLNINIGDSVRFNGTSSHPVAQVSEATWTANGTTPLLGGFAFSSGKGKVAFPDAGTFYYVCTVHASLGMKGKIIVSALTAVDESPSQSFRIYPVPLTGSELTFMYNSKSDRVSIKIYDLSGVLHLSKDLSFMGGRMVVDCSSLKPGAYIVRLQDGSRAVSARLLKE